MTEKANAWQRRVGRRRAVQTGLIGAAGVGAAALIGCNPAEQPAAVKTDTPAQVQPKRGGMLRRVASASGIFPVGMDPHVQSAAQGGNLGMFYQTLIRHNPRTFDPEPSIAQKWEQASQTEFIFTLSPGIKWQNKAPVNGREFTADDVVFSLNRIRTEAPQFQHRSAISAVDKIEATSKSTVKLTLKQPDATVLRGLSGLMMIMLAPEAVERFGTRPTTADRAIGTGPFILQTVDEVSATLVRNPDYWKSGLPYLDGIQLSHIQDDQAAWAAFIGGELDINARIPGTQAKKAIAEGGKDFFGEWFTDVSYTGMQPNTKVKPLDDTRVTQALKLLVDHDEASRVWGETWFGRGYMTAVLGAALSDWDFSEEEYTRRFLEFKKAKDDAAREATRLLSAAGFNRDNPVKFKITGSNTGFIEAACTMLQSHFRQLSQNVVQVEVFTPDLATWQTAVATAAFDYSLNGLVPPVPFEPDSWLTTFYHSSGSRNYSKYSDSRLDGLIEKQRSIFDVTQRKAAVKEALAYIVENAPTAGWAGRFQGNAARSRVKGWAPEANSAIWGFQYEHIWLDA